MPHQNRNNIILPQIKSPVSMDGAFDLGYARHEHTKKALIRRQELLYVNLISIL